MIKLMWQIARNRDLIEDLKPERMEAVRARLTSDPEIALTCFVSGIMPRDDATSPSDPFFRDMYRLTQGSESVSSVVRDCERFLTGSNAFFLANTRLGCVSSHASIESSMSLVLTTRSTIAACWVLTSPPRPRT